MRSFESYRRSFSMFLLFFMLYSSVTFNYNQESGEFKTTTTNSSDFFFFFFFFFFFPTALEITELFPAGRN